MNKKYFYCDYLGNFVLFDSKEDRDKALLKVLQKNFEIEQLYHDDEFVPEYFYHSQCETVKIGEITHRCTDINNIIPIKDISEDEWRGMESIG